MALHKRMDCIVRVVALLVEGRGGEDSSLPATKVDKKTAHQSTSTAGDKEVGGRRRRQWINQGGGPGGGKAVVQGQAEAAMQLPVRVDNKRQQQVNRQKRRQTGGGGVSRCNATTSQDR
jgi:hypothetical protein